MSIEKDIITSEQVTLPQHLEAVTLKSLLPGEATYAEPSAIIYDKGGEGWINAKSQPSRRDQLSFVWLGRLAEGYVADIRTTNHSWQREDLTWSELSDNRHIPLIGLITNKTELHTALNELRQLPGYTTKT